MKQKTKQEMYDGLILSSTWHQQPCPIDDDFSIITIRIPNMNVHRNEEANGFQAFKRIIKLN